MNKFLIAGLGNPGEQYDFTRHNIGFLVLDAIAKELTSTFESVNHGWISKTNYKGKKLMLIKPNTYMNLSGKAVHFWKKKLELENEQILIITDDLHLPLGELRLRGKGSNAGHNGLKSIEDSLQTSNYPRLRFGIGKPENSSQQVDFVLGRWTTEEEKLLSERIEHAKNAALSFCFAGIQNTMNQFNGK